MFKNAATMLEYKSHLLGLVANMPGQDTLTYSTLIEKYGSQQTLLWVGNSKLIMDFANRPELERGATI
ncbi:uncharacterized protein CC84DRAFT_362047 [Paraphaeosphaeria sporulosa]|uniref:Uncharacterized protein n=1 Tax=Paraphaeosphaeria sporulosa TaxID=1460663 RepID=A0A177C0E4_9PLEO|nr:uncharacterized protein CC84DRAFT_362047 [Paraphaeosphaeria sporulosa]OAG00177.1 hypothetical protein CC84DRAFT_362047 [Paraphaeosphaeria sporulosa]